MEIREAIVSDLKTYLESKLPIEFTIIEGFPHPQTSLVYPSLSITASDVVTHLKHPELITWTDKMGTIATVDALYEIADIELPLQLDVWTMSRDQRSYYTNLLVNSLFNTPGRSSDLNLTLPSHYNVHANFQLEDGIKFDDTNEGVQTSQYRTMIKLQATTILVATKEEYKMLHLTLHTKLYQYNPDETEEQITQVF